MNTLAGVVHVDPRPSVQDPSSAPLPAHPAGNGFASDHAAAAGLRTALVPRHRRSLGILVGVGAVLTAVAARLRGSDRRRAATTGAARRRVPGT